jgi:hypothetical protein
MILDIRTICSEVPMILKNFPEGFRLRNFATKYYLLYFDSKK